MKNRRFLQELKDTDINNVDINTLVDIRDVHIDTLLNQKERIRSYINQIKNPYCYRYENMIIKVSFSETGKSLEQRLREYILLQI